MTNDVDGSAASDCYAGCNMNALRAMAELVQLFESESRVALRAANIEYGGGSVVNKARAATMRWASAMVRSRIVSLLAKDDSA